MQLYPSMLFCSVFLHAQEFDPGCLAACYVTALANQMMLQELVTALADECDQSQIPTEYGGTSPVPLYETQIETEFRDFVRNLG